MSYRLAIVGSRSFNNYKQLDEILSAYPKPACIVSGGAKGADSLGQRWAEKNGIPVDIYRPDWNQFGRSAGFKRNVEIVENSDCVLAFWDCESRGTVHSINLAVLKRKPVKVIYTDFPTTPFAGDSIKGFQEEHRWLSNMWPADITMGQFTFKSTEAAYQASKFSDRENVVRIFEKLGGLEAKKQSREYTPKPNWKDGRIENMRRIVRAKFTQIPELGAKLVLTGDAYLEETNSWQDTFWGVCEGDGENWLGKILMEIRASL